MPIKAIFHNNSYCCIIIRKLGPKAHDCQGDVADEAAIVIACIIHCPILMYSYSSFNSSSYNSSFDSSFIKEQASPTTRHS